MSEQQLQYTADELGSIVLFTTQKDQVALYAEDFQRLNCAPENVFLGNVEKATQWVKDNAIPMAMFVDIDKEHYPLESLASLIEVTGPTCKIVALGSQVNLDLYRNMLAQGIFDYLLKPVTLDRLAATLSSMKKGVFEEQLIGRTIAVTGVKGGLGTSTIAFGIAQMLANQSRISTALVDYDRTNGCLGLLAGINQDGGLDGVLKSDNLDVRYLHRSMTQVSDKLSLLNQVPNYQVAEERLADDHVLTLGATLCQMFNQVVWDLPASQPQGALDVLNCAQSRIIVVDYTVTAARNTLRLLENIGDETDGQRIVIVANLRQETSQSISREEFEKFIGRRIDLQLPTAGKVLEQQLLKGPLKVSELGEFSSALAHLVDLACGRPTVKKEKRNLLALFSTMFERKAS